MDNVKRKHYQKLNDLIKKNPKKYNRDLERWIDWMGDPTEEDLKRLEKIPKRSKANDIQN